MVGRVAEALIPGDKDNKVIDAVINPGGFLDQGKQLLGYSEAFGEALQLKGDQKLLAAAGPMANIILQSTTFAGRKISDPERFKAGAAKIASGLADCLDSVDEAPGDVTPIKQ